MESDVNDFYEKGIKWLESEGAEIKFEIRNAGQVVRPFSFTKIMGCVSGFEVKSGSLDQGQRKEDQ